MTLCIILTAEQAAAVAGPSAPHHVLEPRALSDGNYALPVAVLSDPAHREKWPELEDLPQRDLTDADFPPTEDDA
jgi:hypothetical protein